MAEVLDESSTITTEELPVADAEVKPRGGDSSSDSSDDDEKPRVSSAVEATKAKIRRLFGREKSVYEVLGGGRPADLVLWRDKKVSGALVGVATVIWALFELVRYHLLPLICHCIIAVLVIGFVWSSVASLINGSPPKVPEVNIREDLAVNVAMLLRSEINRALAVFRDIASGHELKKFLMIIAGLWILSVFGSCCSTLTLFYIVFLILQTVPLLYEKYDDKVDAFADKAFVQLKRQYTLVDAKVLSKIPRGPFKDKKN